MPQCDDEDIAEIQETDGDESHDPKVDEVRPTCDQPREVDEVADEAVAMHVEQQPDDSAAEAHNEGARLGEIQGETGGNAQGQGETQGNAKGEALGSGAENKEKTEVALVADIATPIYEVQTHKVPDNEVIDNGVPDNEESNNVVSKKPWLKEIFLIVCTHFRLQYQDSNVTIIQTFDAFVIYTFSIYL